MEAFVIVCIVFVVIAFLFIEKQFKRSHNFFLNTMQQKIKIHTELTLLCERSRVLLVSGTLEENKYFINIANAILAKRP